MKRFSSYIILAAASLGLFSCAQPTAQPMAPLSLTGAVQNGNVTFDAQQSGGGQLQFKVASQGDEGKTGARQVMAFAADVSQYKGHLTSASKGVDVAFTITAVNGAANVTFLNLPPASDYTMKVQAFNLANTEVNQSTPNPDTILSGASVDAYEMNRVTALPCPLVNNYAAVPDGGLSANLSASDGTLTQFTRTPEVSNNSKTAVYEPSGIATTANAIGDPNALPITGSMFSGHYSAFSQWVEGGPVHYLGVVTFAVLTNAVQNPGASNYTVTATLSNSPFPAFNGELKRFFLSPGTNSLFAVEPNFNGAVPTASAPYPVPEYVDVQQAPNETFYSSLYGGGTMAHRYYYCDNTVFATPPDANHIDDLFFDTTNSTLLGATLQDANIGIVHIEKL